MSKFCPSRSESKEHHEGNDARKPNEQPKPLIKSETIYMDQNPPAKRIYRKRNAIIYRTQVRHFEREEEYHEARNSSKEEGSDPDTARVCIMALPPKSSFHPATLAAQAGGATDLQTGGVVPAVHMATTFLPLIVLPSIVVASR